MAQNWTLCSSRETGLSKSYLFNGLKSGFFQNGIHTVLIGSTKRLWVQELVLDRIVNIQDEAAHQRAIARFLESLPSNWPARKGKAPKSPIAA